MLRQTMEMIEFAFQTCRKSRPLPWRRVLLNCESLEDRIVLTAPSFSWLASTSGYPTSDLYGTNPPVSELRSTMQQLASQYNVPIEIVAAVCWEESNCMQFDPSEDGFVVRNALEDEADYKYSLDHSPTFDSNGKQVSLLYPPGIGLMQLTGATAQDFAKQYDVPVTKLITEWKLNLSCGVQRLSEEYDASCSSDPPWMKTLDTQNRNILENWFYPLAYYNGYFTGNQYPYTVDSFIGNSPKDMPTEIASLLAYPGATVTLPQAVITNWSYGKGFVATAGGVWYTRDRSQYEGSVHPSSGPGVSVTPAVALGDIAWQSQTSIPQPLGEGGVAIEDSAGRIHVFGGGNRSTAHYLYDPNTNEWSTLSNMPSPGVFDGGAALINSKIYLIGNDGPTAETRIYDPATDSWSTGLAMPTPRDYPAVASAGGKLYAIGGDLLPSDNTAVGTVEAYDPTNNTWTSLKPMPTPRAGASAAVVGNRIFVMGGYGGDHLQSMRTVEVYDTATDTWTEITDQWGNKSMQDIPRQFATAVTMSGKIYLLGGLDQNNNPVASVEEYDPVANVWTALPSSLPAPSSGPQSVLVNGNPYLINEDGTVEEGTARYIPTDEVTLYGSSDPNKLTGPAGLYITPSQPLSYRIDFENDADATLAAQVVVVTNQLDPNLDWTTFRVGDFNIDGTPYTVPANDGSFSERLDLTSTLGIYLDVAAGIDLTTGVATWTFTSIEPATGNVPASLFTGFLQPDRTPPQGEAFLTYTIQPNAANMTGSRIDAQASIIFDSNAAVATPLVTNIVDADPPTSSVDPLPADVNTTSFTVNWSGSDGNGSGIANYNIYVSDNGGDFTLWENQTTQTSATYNGVNGHSYAFYSVARDSVGNVETTPTSAQATTAVDTTQPTSTVVALPSFSLASFQLNWSGSDGTGSGLNTYDVYVSDNGGTFAPLLTDTKQTSTTFTGDNGHTYGFYSIATDNAGNVQETPTSAQASTTVDTTAPTSTVSALPSFSAGSFLLSWSGSDGSGSGIASYNIYVSDNGGTFAPLLTDTKQTSTTFTGDNGHTYGLYSIAIDNVGNSQPTPATAQASTLVDTVPPSSSVNPLPAAENSPNFTVSWSGSDFGGPGIVSYNLFVSDNGGGFSPWLTSTAQTSATYNGQFGHSYDFYSVATNALGLAQPTPTGAQATTYVWVPPSPPTSPPPASALAAPTLKVPPLLALFTSLLNRIESVNSNGTESITDTFFGIPLFVSTFNSAGNLMSVTLLGINITFLFE